jgi:hypothetical protein
MTVNLAVNSQKNVQETSPGTKSGTSGAKIPQPGKAADNNGMATDSKFVSSCKGSLSVPPNHTIGPVSKAHWKSNCIHS